MGISGNPTPDSTREQKDDNTVNHLRKIIGCFIVMTVIAAGMLTSSAVAASAQTQCSTSAQFGMCNYPPYILNNNMWGQVSESKQTLTATSANDWSVTGSEPSGGGVKTYPEDQENFNIPISQLNTCIQNFTVSHLPATAPGDSWEVAADDWLNGTPGSGTADIEVMVWVYNYHQYPAGSNTGKVLNIAGTSTQPAQQYDLYSNGGTLSLVSTTNFTSGAVHMADIFGWLRNEGYIPATSVLKQLDFGEEIVSTNGDSDTWTFSRYNNSIVTTG